jgi:hypothetical protein
LLTEKLEQLQIIKNGHNGNGMGDDGHEKEMRGKRSSRGGLFCCAEK